MSGGNSVRKLHFATVDVFTTKRFTGNPLAIVHLPNNSQLLSPAEKQAIAGEFNLSETVFLHGGDSTNGRRLDIFTTTAELNFAGHPIIGALSFIGQQLKDESTTKIPLKLLINAGTINASFERTTGLVEAEVPHNIHIHQANVVLPDVWDWQPRIRKWSDHIADDALDLEHEMDYKSFPIVSVVKGMTFRLIRLPKIEGSLDALEPRMPSVSTELDDGWSPSYVGTYFYVVLPKVEAGVTTIRARMIDPAIGRRNWFGYREGSKLTFLSPQEKIQQLEARRLLSRPT